MACVLMQLSERGGGCHLQGRHSAKLVFHCSASRMTLLPAHGRYSLPGCLNYRSRYQSILVMPDAMVGEPYLLSAPCR